MFYDIATYHTRLDSLTGAGGRPTFCLCAPPSTCSAKCSSECSSKHSSKCSSKSSGNHSFAGRHPSGTLNKRRYAWAQETTAAAAGPCTSTTPAAVRSERHCWTKKACLSLRCCCLFFFLDRPQPKMAVRPPLRGPALRCVHTQNRECAAEPAPSRAATAGQDFFGHGIGQSMQQI